MKKRTLSLTALILALCLALTGCGQSEEAKAADELIAAIGEVTLESEAQIIEAEEAVAALSEEDRNSLKNDQTLTDARAAYEALVVDQAASEVEEAISAIGTVTLESGEAIQNARKGSVIILVAVYAGLAHCDLAKLNDSELDLNTTMMYRHEDYVDAIRFVREGMVQLQPLMSRHFAFTDYLAAYEYIDTHQETTMKVLIDVDPSDD